MARFYCDYIDKSGDLNHVWVDAVDGEQAEFELESEYWDIQEVVSIRRA